MPIRIDENDIKGLFEKSLQSIIAISVIQVILAYLPLFSIA
jgi:hypothetical protein